jgi:Co/Zn/Cd efflux system component
VGVWFTRSGWPDILIGLALAALFLRSALHVLRGARNELRAVRTKNDPNNFNV